MKMTQNTTETGVSIRVLRQVGLFIVYIQKAIVARHLSYTLPSRQSIDQTGWNSAASI